MLWRLFYLFQLIFCITDVIRYLEKCLLLMVSVVLTCISWFCRISWNINRYLIQVWIFSSFGKIIIKWKGINLNIINLVIQKMYTTPCMTPLRTNCSRFLPLYLLLATLSTLYEHLRMRRRASAVISNIECRKWKHCRFRTLSCMQYYHVISSFTFLFVGV